MTPAAQLSVIIPTLNEAAALPSLLAQLRRQRGIELELIVADGGSDDATADIAVAHGAVVVHSVRGRGRQMNAAAYSADAGHLLFLHADSRLDHDEQLRQALDAVVTADTGDGPIAGHFALQFERSQPGHESLYRFMQGKTASNRRYTINGDQGLLISRQHFVDLGGFDESLSILEDQRIAARIFERGRWLLLPGVLHTSARRFESEGHVPRYQLMAVMMALHDAGLLEFFSAAPEVYAQQRHARTLDLTPFRRLILQLLRARGAAGAIAVIYRCGRFTRRNAWQLAYALDLRRDDGRTPRLHAFDRYIAPLINHPPADAITGLLIAGWFFGLLPLQRGL
ncbi:TIGR04283 family arsenosugar biosynthesis glycosyltransferase [Sinimarinibacterium sp. CAU 1509]|uniref:TIGR04283 family arsenosugar biosynthesis glycosyltransferase n=1 Tax=Sinimarinibacterium sp. CAU 1509 TaxID=2562283 RepID=UPI00146E271F|nr:TIGR04283 family arsenosugar biosynthesis glycosyltransferase [Sinimarinibacterium sp. CAU 1509]